MKYRIGLDLGISSVGWAVLEHDSNDDARRIVDLGVRVFDPAENVKDGSSLAIARREARGLRRRLRRKANRIRKAKKFLGQLFFCNSDYQGNQNFDIFELRYKAIHEQLSLQELYAVVLYFIKHRGFKSNRKSETSSKDVGTLLKAINANEKEAEKYLTIGEYIYKDNRFFVEKTKNGETYREYKIRNHSGAYDNCFARIDLEKELKIILDNQSNYFQDLLTKDNINIILDIFNEQRSFDDGPNEPSPYKSNFAVGKCTLLPDEYRAPKGSFTFEYFNALNKINNLKVLDKDKQTVNITDECRERILELLFKGSDINYSTIRKIMNLPDESRFKNLTYKFLKDENGKKSSELDIKSSEKSNLVKFDKVKQISKALNIEISKSNIDLYDAIAYVLSMRKSDERRIKAFKLDDDIINNLTETQINALKTLNDEQIDALLPIDVTKFGNLSIKAMSNIIPLLEQGLVYDKACEMAGYDFKAISNNEKKYKLKYEDLKSELEEITSPVVKRTISQTIKVINAIIDKYGSPSAIFIEFARELSMNFQDRNKIKKTQELRASENERIEKKLREEFNIIPTGQDIVKYRLYEEQSGKCAYSGKSFEKELGSVKAIFDNNSTQIDHIIPYSKCYDDSYNNKVLVLASENQKKGNRVPMEYMSSEQFENFQNFVLAQYKDNSKKQANLLHKPLSEDQIKELNSRALNDTRYSSRLIKQIIENHLLFDESKFIKSAVRCVNGGITSYLRKIWGLTKNRFASDKHHAQDACVIATATNGMINKITRYFQYKSYLTTKGAFEYTTIDEKEYVVIKETGETILKEEYDREFGPKIAQPYDLFNKEIEARLLSNNPKSETYMDIYKSIGYLDSEIEKIKPVFISRMPTRKVLGQIHKETIRSAPYLKQNKKSYVSSKTSILDLKLDKNNEIADYSEKAKKDDKLLYTALRERLIEFNGNAKDAFKDGFYKPKSDGTQGNPVKTVKTEKVVTDGVRINKGFADNGGMVRVDIFERDGKNYMVPVYVSDVYSGILPNRAVVAYKSKDEWLSIESEAFKFKFSLYPNDLVYLSSFNYFKGKGSDGKEHKVNNEFVYYNHSNITTGALTFFNHDKSIVLDGVGIQRLKEFKKYQVDILGNISEVKHNTRQAFVLKKKR